MFVAVVVADGHGASGSEFVDRQAAAISARPGEDLVLVLAEGGKLFDKVSHVCLLLPGSGGVHGDVGFTWAGLLVKVTCH